MGTVIPILQRRTQRHRKVQWQARRGAQAVRLQGPHGGPPCNTASVQKRVNGAGLRPQPEKGLPGRLAAGQCPEKMDFRRVPTTFRTDGGGSVCPNHRDTRVSAARLLSFWDPGGGLCARQRNPRRLDPKGNPGHGVPNELPW